MSTVERRQFRRVADAVGLQIMAVSDAASPLGTQPAWDAQHKPTKPTHFVRLSPSGLALLGRETLQANQFVQLNLCLQPGNILLRLAGRVLRCDEPLKRHTGQNYFSSISFTDVSNEVRSSLIAHVDQVWKKTHP